MLIFSFINALIGNVTSILATCFLFGPYNQLKKMVSTDRILTTAVYFLMMGITLFLAFYPNDIPGRVILLIIVIIFQFLALCKLSIIYIFRLPYSDSLILILVVWYTISFIPFARDAICNSCCSSCSRDT